MTKDDIHDFEIPWPQERLKIAAILSAYDDLIENNTRRVRVLEQMARALYREWFVEYRYPGHEQAQWVEDEAGRRPQGWEWEELRYLFDVKYGKTLPKTKISSEGEYPVYGAGDIIGFYHQKLENEKVVLVTSRGAGSGHVWRTRSPAFITNNSLIVKPNLLTRHLSYGFIQHLLENSNLLSVVSGAAQPQMTIENLGFVRALLPSKAVMERFNEFILPTNQAIDSLIQRNANLRRTRDLLLPRLVSGELDVSGLRVAGVEEEGEGGNQ